MQEPRTREVKPNRDGYFELDLPVGVKRRQLAARFVDFYFR